MEPLFIFFLFGIAFVIQLLKAGWDASDPARESPGQRRPGGRARVRQGAGGRTTRDRLLALSHALARGRFVRTGQYPQITARLYGCAVRLEVLSREELRYELDDEDLGPLQAEIVVERGELEITYPGAPASEAQTASFLRRPAARRSLAALLHDQGLTRIEIAEGKVRAWGPAEGGKRLLAGRVKRVFHDLRRLAGAAESLNFPDIELKAAPREVAWADRTCPYCRDDLSEGPRVACEHCDTAHHGECWEELGRCTTIGCKGTRGFPITEEPGTPATVRIDVSGCPECGLRGQGCSPGDCQGGVMDRVLHHRRVRGGG